MTAKVCRHCGTEKPTGSFPPMPKCRDGLSSWCRECHRQAARESSARRYVPKARVPRPVSTRVIRRREAECRTCHASFLASKEHLAYCSPECATTARRLSKRGSHPNPDRRRPRNIQECPQCFTEFMGTKTQGLRFCSPQCGRIYYRRIDRDRRRASSANRIHRHEVFTRDAWTCGICSQPVDRSADPKTPEGPTLDHIVPLSRGGAHVEANVQLAHRACNMRKSASWL